MRKTPGLAALAAALACGGANAQQVTVKVGVLSDLSTQDRRHYSSGPGFLPA